MHILLTRPLEDSREMILRFKSLGHQVSHLPLISIYKINYEKINHNETLMRAHVERNILKVLEGDCETAVGAHSVIAGGKITVEAELFSLDGSKRYYEKKTGKVEDFSQIGEEVGQILKTKSNNSYKR